MAKSKHARIITGEQIVVVTPNGKGFSTHMVPSKNQAALKNYNQKLQPEKRSQFFDYEPEHPDMSYYINLASRKGQGGVSTANNDMAMAKMLKKNAQLEETNKKLADDVKETMKTLADLKKELTQLKKAGAKEPATTTEKN